MDKMLYILRETNCVIELRWDWLVFCGEYANFNVED